MLHNAAKLKMSLLHTFNIVEMHFLGNGTAGLGHNLVVVLYLLALVHERSHLGLSSIIDKYRGHLKDSLRVEVLGRVGNSNCCVDVASDTLQNRRIAFYDHVVSQFSHLLG